MITNSVVAVAIEAENDFFYGYQGGIIKQGCGTRLDHAVTAVGYGVEDGQEYIVIKNSWGPSWGENGYARIAPSQCGIKMYPAQVWSVKENTK